MTYEQIQECVLCGKKTANLIKKEKTHFCSEECQRIWPTIRRIRARKKNKKGHTIHLNEAERSPVDLTIAEYQGSLAE